MPELEEVKKSFPCRKDTKKKKKTPLKLELSTFTLYKIRDTFLKDKVFYGYHFFLCKE